MPLDTIANSHPLSRARLWEPRKLASVNLILFALAYFLACGYGTFFAQTAAAPLWFPDSVLLCALLLAPNKRWWLYLAIAVPIRFIPSPHPYVPLWFLWATSLNDMVKATLAASLLRHLTRNSLRLATLSQLAIYLAVAVFWVPALSAVAGAATRQLLGYGFWTSWYQWFLGDALANLVLTPALLYWCWKSFRLVRSAAEVSLWTAGFAVALLLTFRLAQSSYSPIALCVPVPSLLWAATRFGPIGASTALSVIALLGTAGLAHHHALFSIVSEAKSVLFLQVFLFVVSVPMLFVSILIEERNQVEKNLRDSEAKSRQTSQEARYLAGKLINAQDDERRRIAGELHDDIVQRLAMVAVQLDDLQQIVPGEMTEAHDALLRVREETGEAAATLREMSHQLHSTHLQYLGLGPALKGLCRSLAEKQHIVIKLEVPEQRHSSPELDLCLFRIAQEALSNAIRHSHAREIAVRVFRSANQLCLEVRDDGNGFNPSEASKGLGLISMRERVGLLNGTIEIESSPMRGTAVLARVPLASERASEGAAD